MPDRHPDQPLRDRGQLARPSPPALQRRLHPAEAGGEHPQPVPPRSASASARRPVRCEISDPKPAMVRAAPSCPGSPGSPGYRTRGPPDGRPAVRPGSARWPGAWASRSGQRPQPAEHQVGLHRPGYRAVQLPGLRPGPTDRVVLGPVTAAPSSASECPDEQLGERVHHDVGAEVERTLQQGSGEGVVHHRRHPPASSRRTAGQVGYLHHRVGRRLQPDQIGALGGGQYARRCRPRSPGAPTSRTGARGPPRRRPPRDSSRRE